MVKAKVKEETITNSNLKAEGGAMLLFSVSSLMCVDVCMYVGTNGWAHMCEDVCMCEFMCTWRSMSSLILD